MVDFTTDKLLDRILFNTYSSQERGRRPYILTMGEGDARFTCYFDAGLD